MSAMPKINDDVYVPTISDDNNIYYVGGLAKVVKIIAGQIIVEEHNSANYRWKNGLDAMQESLKKQFGNQRASSTGIIPPCPLE
ncbi:MAG: hypothetical protein A3B96_01085 [Candidatus Spechtbacteria bacterium RIFCSPHIGHO2_02_FULL_43_15b]|uniref:Uncharacterized protein n=1 Tax=Candidatus Spechtbacteria bacterium RIFCSPHIGHO2_01_FULL_43_30 TaxID=1802158 RepID=A0A1G2H538_9BACT|nr:MAG: hypothetical protein A2827_03485 [Candidatus Spechtbacteria bacterium RIFCSPHIGHO2_01_FULL_43_30]OGZ59008.1 MAG: hypothetical protein A3B96_01085 [Candidatus Spechtbacteria bacterium RIFCSPHIGHO2_02_FULL_43_15b]